ncbi:hypothetical protein QQF64_016156 [Cirrhinus molitorella]|uniref:Uncharacterized protein n=1 Tax=Cirrhinus molitorella TaxID=172907 RepID=A0ABR3LM32_9TELE
MAWPWPLEVALEERTPAQALEDWTGPAETKETQGGMDRTSGDEGDSGVLDGTSGDEGDSGVLDRTSGDEGDTGGLDGTNGDEGDSGGHGRDQRR